jgi:hypothetical protein
MFRIGERRRPNCLQADLRFTILGLIENQLRANIIAVAMNAAQL